MCKNIIYNAVNFIPLITGTDFQIKSVIPSLKKLLHSQLRSANVLVPLTSERIISQMKFGSKQWRIVFTCLFSLLSWLFCPQSLCLRLFSTCLLQIKTKKIRTPWVKKQWSEIDYDTYIWSYSKQVHKIQKKANIKSFIKPMFFS